MSCWFGQLAYSGKLDLWNEYERTEAIRFEATITPKPGVLRIFLVFPLIAPYNALATQILIWGLFALAFNIVYSNSGLFSLGHAAFYGLGAYGTGLILPSAYGTGAIIARFKVNSLPISLAAGALFAGAGALIIGFFCLRRRGIYFSMLTLAFSQLLYFTAYQASSLTGGHSGLRGIPAFTLDLGPFQIPLDHPINFCLLHPGAGWLVRAGHATHPKFAFWCCNPRGT